MNDADLCKFTTIIIRLLNSSLKLFIYTSLNKSLLLSHCVSEFSLLKYCKVFFPIQLYDSLLATRKNGMGLTSFFTIMLMKFKKHLIHSHT